MKEREIEKLHALGYEVVQLPITQRDKYGGSHRVQTVGHVFGMVRNLDEKERDIIFQPIGIEDKETEKNAWKKAKTHSQSPEGLKATMADKVRWLNGVHFICEVGESLGEPQTIAWFCERNGEQTEYHDSPEAAVDALFWKVP